MLKPFLRNVSGKPSKSDITMFTGGLNTCYDKSMIRDNQMAYMWNMTLNNAMSMTTRSNRTSIASFLHDTTNWGNGEIKKMFATSDKTILTIEKHNSYAEVYELKIDNIINLFDIELLNQEPDYNTYDETTGLWTTSSMGGFFRSILYKVNGAGTTKDVSKLVRLQAGNYTIKFFDFSTTSTASNAISILPIDENGSRISIIQSSQDTIPITLEEDCYIDIARTDSSGAFSFSNIMIVEGTYTTNTFPSNIGVYLKKDYIGQVENSSFYSITECRDSSTKYFMISTLHKLYKISKDALTEVLEDVTGDPPVVGVLVAHKNRLFVGNGIDLYISKLREYDDFTVEEGEEESGQQIRITNANGDIKALVPYDDKLVILCERSMHILYGDSPLSEINQFTIVDLNNGLGCISDETWTICNKQLYWLDTDMSVYRYNGSGIIKISEEYGADNYASYGGISGITYNPLRLKQFIMSSYGDCVYIGITQSRLAGAVNDTLLVYNTKNRVWWAEDGAFFHMTMWETDSQTPFYYATDYLIGSMYNNDVVIMNALQKIDTDHLFNMETRHFEDIPIEYAFETKTWTLGTIKKEKTLSNLWFQANAEGRVAVCDYWNEHNVWDGGVTKLDENYLILGNLKKVVIRHNIQNPTASLHQGTERQRFIIPRMYLQKINAFSIRVEGTGYGEFYMMEKEWRIK